MRVLQVNTVDANGGAGRIGWNLFEEYRKRGHESHLAVGSKTSADPNVFEIPNREARNAWMRSWNAAANRLYDRPRLNRLANYIAKLGEPTRELRSRLGLEDFNHPGTKDLLALPPQRPQILHCHNLHGDYFDLRALSTLSSRIPVVLTLHDQWLMTGHCAHSLECGRWQTGCGHCPDLTIYPAIHRDGTAANWGRKKHIFEACRLFVASPSKWLLQEAKRSVLNLGVVGSKVIPNGVDLTVFSPGDKQAAREVLHLPADAWVALFVGDRTRSNPFKDVATIREAVALAASEIDTQQQILICLGEEGEQERIGSAIVRSAPFERDIAKVAEYYRAADVYLHAAKADTFPNAVLEALACGTPVIATSVCGIPEQIEDGQTGFLVKRSDSEEMAARLRQMHDNSELSKKMGAAAAHIARGRFDSRRMAAEYLGWYDSILEASS